MPVAPAAGASEGQVSVGVAPLSLPGVNNACYGLTVRNGEGEMVPLGAVEDYETPQLAFPKFALPDSAKMALRSELLPKGMR